MPQGAGAQAALAALGRGDEPRTWSLILTVFGDLASGEGAAISGPVLSAITGRIGVRPEAMRVALYRLRKDGWLVSDRCGRVSRYRLTAGGRAEVAEASGRIYARTAPEPESWQMVAADPGDVAERAALEAALAPRGAVAVAPGLWLCPAGGALPGGVLALEGPAPVVPDWLHAQLMPEALAARYAGFAAALAEAQAALAGADPPPLDRAALRVLLVHGWRRLVLRHPALPDGFFPAHWAGPDARRRVHDLLDALGVPSLAEIAEAGGA